MEKEKTKSKKVKENKVFKCTVEGCDSTFSKNSKLIFHIRKHTGERPFLCDVVGCDKSYTNSSHLRRHKKVNHGDKAETKGLPCDHPGCGLILANKYSLKKHLNRKHNLENYPFKCEDCNQGFHKKRQLLQHVYIHTGIPAFECDECGVSFTANRLLSKHKRSHRTYSCDCGENFSRWSLILIHRKTCKKPRFICPICDKPFSHSGNYKNHQVTHMMKTDRDVFVCPYQKCNRFYFFKRNLKVHINEFHKNINADTWYNCTYPNCKAVLKRKHSLKLHLERHFKWIPKRQRKIRSDKGTIKKAMMSVLTGELPDKDNSVEQIFISENLIDEALLRHHQADTTQVIIN